MSIIRKEFEHELDVLKAHITVMGNRVERTLGDTLLALQNSDLEEARRIIKEDVEINNLEHEVEDLCARLIATQQPVAKDLRRILVSLKIANDLERMADLSVDIAKVTLRLDGQQHFKPLVDLPQMAEMVQQMTYEAIQSFSSENVDLAYKMARDDDQVDAKYAEMLQELFTLMNENPQAITQATFLSFVVRYIERIADYATNIGENVVYLVTGERPELNK